MALREEGSILEVILTDMLGDRALTQRNEMRATVGRRVRFSIVGWNFQLSQRKK